MTNSRAGSSRISVPGMRGLHTRSGNLIVSFRYKGKTYYESTGYQNSTHNRQVCMNMLEGIKADISKGDFSFGVYFPDSPRAKIDLPPSRKTIGELVPIWWSEWKNGALLAAPSTAPTYEGCINRHIVPKLGHMALENVTVQGLKSWEDGLTHSKTGAPLSKKRKENTTCCLRRFFEYAEGIGCFKGTDNPWKTYEALKSGLKAKVKSSAEAASVETLVPYTAEERDSILTRGFSDKEESERNMVGFNFAMGLRIGELLALTWDKVNWKRKTIKVDMQVHECKYKRCKAGSDRELGLTEEAIDWLQKQYNLDRPAPCNIQMLEDRLDQKEQRISTSLNDVEFVFFNSNNQGPFTKAQTLSKRWGRIIKKAGVCEGSPRVRTPNYMRHTFASRILTNGAPMEYVAQQLGNTVEACKLHYATLIKDDFKHDHDLKNRYLEG